MIHEHRFLKEWCGGVYHMMVIENKTNDKEIPQHSQRQLNFHFKAKLKYTATFAGDKMTVDSDEYTIIYTHSRDMDERLVSLTRK